MPFDTIAFMESAARDGLAGVAGAAGENLYAVSGDEITIRSDGVIFMAQCVTAAIANFDEFQFHKKTDAEWVHSRQFVRDQAGVMTPNSLMRLAYPVSKGDVIVAEADNGNNAQIEAVLLWIAYGSSPQLTTDPAGIPTGARWIQGAGGTAAVAATWTQSTMTYDYNFKNDKKYQVLGMVAHSATGYAVRLKYKGGSSWLGYGAGIPMGDSNILTQPIYGDFGTFEGLTPPDIEVLCSGTDAAQYVDLLIVEG